MTQERRLFLDYIGPPTRPGEDSHYFFAPEPMMVSGTGPIGAFLAGDVMRHSFGVEHVHPKRRILSIGRRQFLCKDVTVDTLDDLDTIVLINHRVESFDETILMMLWKLQGGPDRITKISLLLTSILFLAADPTDASRLRLGEEFREIHGTLRLAQLRDRFKLELPQLSVRPADISQALLDVHPQIVHFSGHGASTGALCFENQRGQTHLVPPDALAALFKQFAHQVKCVLLNACYSETQAEAIAEHIEYVIGMNQAIGDKAAIAFAIGFYQALGAGRTIEDAYTLGCVQIGLQSQGIPEHLTPVLIKKGQTQP